MMKTVRDMLAEARAALLEAEDEYYSAQEEFDRTQKWFTVHKWNSPVATRIYGHAENYPISSRLVRAKSAIVKAEERLRYVRYLARKHGLNAMVDADYQPPAH